MPLSFVPGSSDIHATIKVCIRSVHTPVYRLLIKRKLGVFGSFAVGGRRRKGFWYRVCRCLMLWLWVLFTKLLTGSITLISIWLIAPWTLANLFYGLQFGASYKVNDWLSVLVVDVWTTLAAVSALTLIFKQVGTELVAIELDCDQTGWD